MQENVNYDDNYANKDCNKLTYTIPEVSKLLNISVSQTYKLANQNVFPIIRLGKRILVSKKRIEEFINQ